MSHQTLILGDCLEKLGSLPVADLVIADPPYFKVVNEKWDYQWRTEEEYLEWCKKWIKLVYDKLRYGGTFYLFGYYKMLALLTPYLLEIGFSVRQEIVIDKGMRAVAGRATKKYKMFPNTTERLLFLVKNNIPYSRELLKTRQKELGLTAKEINESLGVKSNGGGMWSIYTGKNVCEQFPTKEIWEKLQSVLKFDVPYEKVAQTYNPIMGLNDVWTDIDFYEEKRIHPTQKPVKLMERLISVSSNEGDNIIDPFAGSGSTMVASEKLGRTSYSIEQEETYYKEANERPIR